MNRNPTQIFLILGGIAISMFAGIKLLRGGWMDMLWFMACLVPFVLALVLGLRKWWPVLAILIPQISLPTAGQVLLDKITPSVAFNLLIIAFFFGHVCITRSGVSPRVRFIRPLLIVAVFLTLRVVVDPPGSGRVGGTGGMQNALYYLIAVWVSFPLIWVVSEGQVSDRKLFKLFLYSSILLFIIQIARDPSNVLYELYHRRSWLMWPFILAAIANQAVTRPDRKILFHVLSLAIMGFALVNPHRKSIFMAAIFLMSMAWIYRFEKRQIVILGTAGAVGLAVLISMGRVPKVMQRSLSTILPSMTVGQQTRGHMGWQDDFRFGIFQYAMQDIARSPVIGKGFKWSTADAVRSLRRKRIGGMDATSKLAVQVGNTHFGFIDLMMRVGVVIPWFYAYALIGTLTILIWTARSMPPGYSKGLAAAMAGFGINSLFQWLLNGVSAQMIYMSVIMGICIGLLIKWGPLRPAEQRAAHPIAPRLQSPRLAEAHAMAAAER
jgi:hypothetical protein